MKAADRLLDREPVVVTVGVESLASALDAEGVRTARVDWRPPLGSDPALGRYASLLLRSERVQLANTKAMESVLGCRPILVDVVPAYEAVPLLKERALLHAGPPVEWGRMCGPMRGAVVGAILYEGWAATPEKAEAMAASGAIRFAPCHEHHAVGPMAGLVSSSMPMMVVEDAVSGRRSYSTFNEGLGKVLRYGAFSKDVLDRLEWIRDVLGPAVKAAIRRDSGIDVRGMISEALQMGDEGHNRNRAGTSLLFRAIAPRLMERELASSTVAEVLRFISGNDHFFLNLSMAASKCATEAASLVPDSTLVTVMARNGTDFGIRVSGLGDRWFAAPAATPEGLYLPGFGPEDRNPDIGDSAITETAGIGGFAMAAAPAIVRFVGGSASDAFGYTREMYEITLAEHPHYRVPALDFRGTPVGIDLARVVRSGIRPVINTGMAHRLPGVGQIGAGVVRAPAGCFVDALAAMKEVIIETDLEREQA